MFPSNNCTTSNDSIIAYFNKTTFLNPNKNTNYINIFPNNNPKQEDNNLPPLNVQPTSTTPLPFFGFSTSPSPFEIGDHEDHFFLHQNHLVNVSPHNSQPNHDHQNINNIVTTISTTTTTSTTTNVAREPNTTTLVDSSLKMKKKINPPIDQEKITSRKRATGKRDRHSKINTARGLRDRRMRLSLEVAPKFFGLQDMLGFDKASKTVEWLLTQSKSEINKLERELNYFSSCTKSASSTNSEGEVVSCNLDEVAINIEQQHSTINGSSSCKPLVASTKRKKRQLRKIVFNPLAKESREKARERARERTKEKDNLKSRSIRSSLASTIVVDHHHESSKPSDQHQDQEIRNNNHDHLRILSCWSTTPYDQSREESGLSQSHNNINNSSSLEVLPQEVEEPISSHQENFTAAGDNNVNVDDHSFVNIEKYWSPSALIFNSLHNNEISQHEQNFADFPILWQSLDP